MTSQLQQHAEAFIQFCSHTLMLIFSQ